MLKINVYNLSLFLLIVLLAYYAVQLMNERLKALQLSNTLLEIKVENATSASYRRLQPQPRPDVNSNTATETSTDENAATSN